MFSGFVSIATGGEQKEEDLRFPYSRSFTEAEENEERVCNYERYRVVIHNEATGGEITEEKYSRSYLPFGLILVSEEQCLRDIDSDERFGALRDDHHHHPASKEAKKKK